MATEYGFVYFLSNDAMPGIYKIGFTTNHPKTRLDQLSASTSCPLPFELLACFGVANPREIESEIHNALDNYRINSSREFFKCDPTILRDAIWEYCDEEDDLVNTYKLDRECSEYEFLFEERWKKSYFYSQSADPIYWPTPRKGFD